MHFKSTKHLLHKSTKLCYTNSSSQKTFEHLFKWTIDTPGHLFNCPPCACVWGLIHLFTWALTQIFTITFSYYIHSTSTYFTHHRLKIHTHPIKIKSSILPKLIFAQTKNPSILPKHLFINNLFTFMTYFSNNSILYYNHKREVSTNYLTKIKPFQLNKIEYGSFD